MVGKNWLKVLLIAVKKISINVKRQIFIASAKKPRVFQWVKSHWTWFLGVNHLLIECQKPEGGQSGGADENQSDAAVPSPPHLLEVVQMEMDVLFVLVWGKNIFCTEVVTGPCELCL